MPTKIIRIIICDDHETIRRSLSYIFSLAPGFEIVSLCKSGLEAIQETKQLKPDILLLDINMPSPDGFDVAKTLQGLKLPTRIIAVSVSTSPEFCKKMTELGAKGYITKTSPPEEFIEGVKQVSKGKMFLCKEIKDALA